MLQKLQAENISLKAQLKNMNGGDVDEELEKSVQEITHLQHDLQETRQQVLQSKAKLVQATAQLQAAQEQKGYESIMN